MNRALIPTPPADEAPYRSDMAAHRRDMTQAQSKAYTESVLTMRDVLNLLPPSMVAPALKEALKMSIHAPDAQAHAQTLESKLYMEARNA